MEEKQKLQLRQLGNKYLNERGQRDMEVLLQDGDMSGAKEYLLGAIDSLWWTQQITDDEAREAFKLIGTPPAKAAEVRQHSKHWQN